MAGGAGAIMAGSSGGTGIASEIIVTAVGVVVLIAWFLAFVISPIYGKEATGAFLGDHWVYKVVAIILLTVGSFVFGLGVAMLIEEPEPEQSEV